MYGIIATFSLIIGMAPGRDIIKQLLLYLRTQKIRLKTAFHYHSYWPSSNIIYVWSSSGSHHEKLLALPRLHCQATISTTCDMKCYTEDPHLCSVILCESVGQESSECALTHTSFPREHQQLVLDSFHFFLNFLNGFMEGKTTEKALTNKRYLYLKMEGVG